LFYLSRDNLPALQLQTWDLNANMYDGTTTAGPVPTIFSDDQQATIDAMVSDPAQAHKDVIKINRYKCNELGFITLFRIQRIDSCIMNSLSIYIILQYNSSYND
jgi:hypothetical protein